jgi:ATP-binding cassette subfamily B protein
MQQLRAAAWPEARIAEALTMLAEHAGLAAGGSIVALPGGHVAEDRLNAWIEAAAAHAGLETDQVFVGLDEIDTLLAGSAPALVRMAAIGGAPFLAVLGATRGSLRVVGPDRRVHRLRASAVAAVLRAPFEAPVQADVDRQLDTLDLGRGRERARARMLADRLKSVHFRGCWLVRLPPGAPTADGLREAGVLWRLAVLALAYIAQYGLFVLSWWLLGRAILNGTVDRGWLLGWIMLLISLVPLRIAATWSQGRAAIALGAWLRRRLLRGAFSVDRQDVRRRGTGQLFSLVVESSAVDALALSGGLSAAFAVFELAVASVVLWAGASGLLVLLLIGWVTASGYLAFRYFRRRDAWTGVRFRLTEQLLESMVGHRTKLVQQARGERYQREDETLDGYLENGRTMDAAGLWLSGFIPRGWLVVALASMVPLLEGASSVGRLAISIGGVLLAYRALQRLAAGLSSLIGAIVAARSVTPLAKAAATKPLLPLPSTLLTAPAPDTMVARAKDLTFRYRAQGEPVLQDCSINIERNARLMLEGPSGSGKTTLGAVLAGLEQPESGLLLINGFDRSSLGTAGWRSRVVMAPQAHDNYLVGGSLAFNLMMGRRWPAERADLVEAEAICRDLGLGDLLDRLPGGLNQIVGETGWQLSQGERTRVFLARALLQHPDLLVLDESFSALDWENVDRAMRCVTARTSAVLAIAHP